MIKKEIDFYYILTTPFWFVELSDGSTVYQYDFNEEGEHVNSWLELKEFVKQEKMSITKMGVRFRDHVEIIAEGAPGYFFVYSMITNLADGATDNFYTCGYLEDETVHTRRWRVPELILIEPGERSIHEEITERGLIRNA